MANNVLLGKLQALPKDGKPHNHMGHNSDIAYLEVATGIRTICWNFLYANSAASEANTDTK